jgi:hypothetical protein
MGKRVRGAPGERRPGASMEQWGGLGWLVWEREEVGGEGSVQGDSVSGGLERAGAGWHGRILRTALGR